MLIQKTILSTYLFQVISEVDQLTKGICLDLRFEHLSLFTAHSAEWACVEEPDHQIGDVGFTG